VATISANASYTLTCTWGGGSATIAWTAPTTNTDGSSLTDLTSYNILFGTSSTALNQSQSVKDPKATSATIAALGTGTWYFSVRAVNSAGVESSSSNVAQKSVTAASAAKTVAISVTPTTPPPTTTTLKTVSTVAYDVLMRNNVRVLGRQVGTVKIGTVCQSHYVVGTSYYKVAATDVKVTIQPRSNTIVAKCAKS
jgi:hypothetical protein